MAWEWWQGGPGARAPHQPTHYHASRTHTRYPAHPHAHPQRLLQENRMVANESEVAVRLLVLKSYEGMGQAGEWSGVGWGGGVGGRGGRAGAKWWLAGGGRRGSNRWVSCLAGGVLPPGAPPQQFLFTSTPQASPLPPSLNPKRFEPETLAEVWCRAHLEVQGHPPHHTPHP